MYLPVWNHSVFFSVIAQPAFLMLSTRAVSHFQPVETQLQKNQVKMMSGSGFIAPSVQKGGSMPSQHSRTVSGTGNSLTTSLYPSLCNLPACCQQFPR